MKRTTVYPSRAGGFPPASFPDFGAALCYVNSLRNTAPCGICMCPAESYWMHYPDTVRPAPLEITGMWVDEAATIDPKTWAKIKVDGDK